MKKTFSLLAFLLTTLAISAQNGNISGRVKDASGLGISKANVVIVDGAGNVAGKATKTDINGNYSLIAIAPGKYNLMFSAKNFQAVTATDIRVNGQKSTFFDVSLNPHREK